MRDADERSGKPRPQRVLADSCAAKNNNRDSDVEREIERERKVCYPHIPDPCNGASKCHEFFPGDRPHGRYLISP